MLWWQYSNQQLSTHVDRPELAMVGQAAERAGSGSYFLSLGPHPRARIDVLALISTIQGSGRRPEVGVGADAVMWRRGTTDRCRRPSEVDDDAHPQEGATTIADMRNRGGKKTSLLLYPDGPAAPPAGFLLVEPNVFKESKPSYLRTGPPCSL